MLGHAHAPTLCSSLRRCFAFRVRGHQIPPRHELGFVLFRNRIDHGLDEPWCHQRFVGDDELGREHGYGVIVSLVAQRHFNEHRSKLYLGRSGINEYLDAGNLRHGARGYELGKRFVDGCKRNDNGQLIFGRRNE